ncbi:unnamed protein product [Nippostrongylus brasiliensis]|uniref:Transposase n=1 Tax=Nippostrongylus brasiliensis TaxID=27835 RepID=A0A0N4XFF5_NIPBR|nr:unnamed protein product [Nippostrongylus brasiliensis]
MRGRHQQLGCAEVQLISHDITKNALANVCTRTRCVQFSRSFQVCGTGVGNRPREQYNENTAFIDGSTVSCWL